MKFLLLLFTLSLSAQGAEEKAYNFPLKDSLRATFLAAIYRPMNLFNWPEYQPNQTKALGVRYLNLHLPYEQASPGQRAENCDSWKLDPAFWRRDKSKSFRFGWNNLWGQYEYVVHNKLLLIVPGMASGWDNHIATYLAEFALQNGFRPLVVDSPFHPEFIRRTSRNGLIGNTRQDAEDLYGALRWAAACGLRDMTREYDSYVNAAVDTGRLPGRHAARFKKRYREGSGVYLLGYSLGALQSAYLSQIDREQQAIGFRRVLLLNPPFHQKHGLETIDAFGRPKQELSFFEWLFKLLLGPYFCRNYGKSAIKSPEVPPVFSPAQYFQGFLNGRCLHKLSREELQSAIHHTLSSFVPKAVRAALQRVEREHPEDFLRISPRYQRGAQTFLEYLRNIYFPLLGERAGPKELDRFLEENGLQGSLLKEGLKRDGRVFLLHNKDDFLLRCTRKDGCDWQQLVELFREGATSRAKIYPYGGHLGNLWFRKNQEDILHILKKGTLP